MVGNKDRKEKRLLLRVVLLILTSTLSATIMSLGIWDMIKSLSITATGNPKISSGDTEVAYSLGQSNAQKMTGGNFELVSGYHQELGTIPKVSTATMAAPVQVGSVVGGVGLQATLQIKFSEALDPASLNTAISVTAIRDRNQNAIQQAAAISINYDDANILITIKPAASWTGNTLYEMVMTTQAHSFSGLPIASSVTHRFQTILNKSEDNVFVSLEDNRTEIFLPAETLPKPGYLIIKSDPQNDPNKIDPSLIVRANDKIVAKDGAFRKPVMIREINAYDTDNQPMQLARNGQITMRILDSDNDGIVDGTNPPIKTKNLTLWHLDEEKALWVKEPNTSTYGAGGRVVTALRHLSVYALIGAADANVEDVYAYPVPWKPYSDNPSRYGTLSEGITFTNLPSEGTIRLFSVSGDLVYETTIPVGSTSVKWMGTNTAGSSVASGVYIWEIRSQGNRKTGKVAIVW